MAKELFVPKRESSIIVVLVLKCQASSPLGCTKSELAIASGAEEIREKTRLVKQRLPSVSTGRPQLLRTNIRHAVGGVRADGDSSIRTSAFGGRERSPQNRTRDFCRSLRPASNDRLHCPSPVRVCPLDRLPRNARERPSE